MIDYVAAGFDPSAFWSLTPRLFDLHMRGAIQRGKREATARNLQAYNTAALMGAAMAGKLEPFGRVFPDREARPAVQTPEQLQMSFDALAAAWGAEKAEA